MKNKDYSYFSFYAHYIQTIFNFEAFRYILIVCNVKILYCHTTINN